MARGIQAMCKHVYVFYGFIESLPLTRVADSHGFIMSMMPQKTQFLPTNTSFQETTRCVL